MRPDSIYHFVFFLLLNCTECIGFYSAAYFDSIIPPRLPGFKFSPDKGIPDDKSKMFLWRLRWMSLRWLGEYWSKPVCTCLTCMGSLHSLAIWAPIYLITTFRWYYLPLHAFYILCLCGLNRMAAQKFEL